MTLLLSKLLKQNHSFSDRGAFMPLFAIVMVAFLAIGGLAVDLGRMYRVKINLQKALDAGVVAGLGYRVKRGPYELFKASQAKQTYALDLLLMASRSVRANLKALGMNDLKPFKGQFFDPTKNKPGYLGSDVLTGGTFDTYYSHQNEVLSLAISYPVKLIVLDKLASLGISGVQQVAVSARGQINPAYVSLLLDFSGSMLCPAEGACDSLLAPNSPAAKVARLKEAAVSFVKMFKPKRDSIQLVPYNVGAKVEKSIRDSFRFHSNLVQKGWVEAIRDLDPNGNTNPSEALLRSYQDLTNPASTISGNPGDQLIFGNREVSYVYFSDGAPTAGSFLFANPVAGELDNNSVFGLNHYSHYKVEWQRNGSSYDSPSGLVEWGTHVSATGAVEDNLPINHMESHPLAWFRDPRSHFGAGTDLYDIVPDCSWPRDRFTIDSGAGIESIERFDEVFANCLNDFSFRIPGEDKTYGTNVAFSSKNADYLAVNRSWQEQYYNVTLALADMLRANRAVFYTIGLGNPASTDPGMIPHPYGLVGLPDPYQNTLNDNDRKDFFLTRLANDQFAPSTMKQEFYQPLVMDTNLANWEDLEQYRSGEYLATADPQELRALFLRIAKRILLRLIS